MPKTVWFDMDGTIANLYEVENWLPKIIAGDASPYEEAEPMLNMQALARQLNNLQFHNVKIGIVSWLAKDSTPEYDEKVKAAKLAWLAKHLKSVRFDTIHIVPYGTNKWELCKGGFLFDDEEKNRKTWLNGCAFIPSNITTVLKSIRKVVS